MPRQNSGSDMEHTPASSTAPRDSLRRREIIAKIYPLMLDGTEMGKVNECHSRFHEYMLNVYYVLGLGQPPKTHRHTCLFSSLHAGGERPIINNYYRHGVVCNSNTQEAKSGRLGV